jgi:thiol-disulfide isomerase/thioredoxin
MFKRCFPLLMLLSVLVLTSCVGAASATVVEAPISTHNLTFIHFYSDECPNCLVMIPIVDKLATQYSDKMTFKTLNVETDGKTLYDELGLNGQPIFVIMKPNGDVVYKGFGRVPEQALDGAIQKAIRLEGA